MSFILHINYIGTNRYHRGKYLRDNIIILLDTDRSIYAAVTISGVIR